MKHVTKVGRWEITLVDGSSVEVWADGYQEHAGSYVFGVLAEVDEAEQKDLLILGTAPSNPRRVIVGLSRFPIEAVRDINGG